MEMIRTFYLTVVPEEPDIFCRLKYPTYTEPHSKLFLKKNQEWRMIKGTAMAKSLKFVFQFPPINGIFDAGHGIVYIFGGLYEGEIENIIVHETLHYVLLRRVGKKACLRLDRIYTEFDE